MFKKTLSLLACTAILSSCSTIINGSMQPVNVASNPAVKAECTLKDNKGVIYNVTTPGSVMVKRGDGPIDVVCEYKSKEGTKVVRETIEPWFFGNLILGGPIGLIIDAVSGSYQKYPDDIMITLTNK